MTGNLGNLGEHGRRAGALEPRPENRRKSRKRFGTYVDFALRTKRTGAYIKSCDVRTISLRTKGAYKRTLVVRTRQSQEETKTDISRASESALTSISNTSPEAQARGHDTVVPTRRMSPRWRVGASVLWCAVLSLTAFCSPAVAKETLVRNVPEFDAALKAAGSGDTILLADGEWRDADLVFRGEGTKAAPITMTAQTPGKVVLLGTSRLRIGGTHLVVRNLLWRDSSAKDDVVSFRYDSKNLASHCTLEECAIIGDVPDKERKFVSIYGEQNQVLSCRFEGKQSKGTLLVVWLGENAPPNNHNIDLNFFGPRERLGKNGGEIIRVGDSKTSLQRSVTEVKRNYFYRCSGEAEIISNKSCENVYTGNVFVGCGGALTLRHGNSCMVDHNQFFGDGQKGTGGVRVIGEGHSVADNMFFELLGTDGRAALSLMNGVVDSPLNGYFQVKDAVVVYNLFLDCKESVLMGSSDEDQKHQTLPPTGCTLALNKIVTRGEPAFKVRTMPIGLRGKENSHAGGPLGMDGVLGWEVDQQPADEIRADNGPTLENLQVRPSEVGPKWMKPGDEFLPEVLKKLRAKQTTLKEEKK